MELEVKSGYKNTELGYIPMDWSVERIEDIATIQRGKFTPRPRNNPIYYGGDIPFVQTGDVTRSNGLISQYSQTLNEKGLEVSKLFGKGTILMTIAANIGYTGILEMDMACPDSLIGINGINSDNRFLNYYFQWKRILIEELSTSGAQKNLNIELFRPFKIPLPPTIEEQQAIANALRDVDALIASSDTLIAKKKAIKKGAMQQLLTPPSKGGKRLPGFEGEWVERSLGEFCKITTGKLDANAMVKDGAYRFYTCAKNHYYINDFAFDTEALLISGNGANVGYVHYYKGKFNAYQRTYVLDGFVENIHMVKHYLDRYLSIRINSEKNEGNTPYIVMGTLQEMLIWLPPTKEEQEAIATILSDMDKEIEALEDKKEKYKQIKQGMAQELLTGKTRLA